MEPLDWKHKDLLFRQLKELSIPLSEYSFANLFLFRRKHNYQVLAGERVLIMGLGYDGTKFIMPAFDIKKVPGGFLRDIAEKADHIFPIPEEYLSMFDPKIFEASFKDCDSDYVYDTKKLMSYSGNKLHKKKNLMYQFLKLYEHKALPLTRDRFKDAALILDEWQSSQVQQKEETDYYACLEALELYDELTLCGGIYYVEGEPAGFLIGEELAKDSFVLHFAKARTKFKGLYQFMYNNFAKILPVKYAYINLEQDLCDPSLRQTKMSYAPEKMLKKYRVSLI